MPLNDSEKQRIEARRLKAWALRVEGKSYAAIGAALSVSTATAFFDVRAMLEKARDEANESVEHHRGLQLARIDKAVEVLMTMLDDPETSLQAIDRLAKIERRRAELLGLDAPKHVVVQRDATGFDEMTDEQLERFATTGVMDAPPSRGDDAHDSSGNGVRH